MTIPIPNVDLRPDHWAIVRSALRRHVPDREVLAFGSRVTWTAKDYSDLDLAVMGEEPLSPRTVSALDEALGDSDLPFKVDVVDWARIGDGFRRIIRRHGVTVQDPLCGCLPRMPAQCTSSSNVDWVSRRIGDLGRIVGGGTPSTKEPAYFGGDVPWLTPRDLSGTHERRIRRGVRNLSQKGLASSSAKLLPPGTVLLSTRAPVGYVAVAANPIATNQGFRNVIVNPEHDPGFLYYWLKANTQELQRHATGSTFMELSGSALKRISVRLPKRLSEQRAIAQILGTLDDKIELNRRMNEALEAMARALFKSWFVDFDPVRAKMEGRDMGIPDYFAELFPRRLVGSEMGEVPEGWVIRTLGDLCHKPQYGFTASAQSEPVGPKFLRITDINKKSWVSWSRVPHCRATDEESLKYRLTKGDVLIARMADPGHGILVEEDLEAVFASYLIRFRPMESGTGRFLQYWLRSDAYWHLVRERATGTTRRSLNATVLSRFPLVDPPAAVLWAFASVVDSWRRRLVANVGEMETLAALRDALIPKLISGEVRVPDPEQFLASST